VGVLSYCVCFEVEHQEWSACVSLLGACVCGVWLGVPLVVEVLAGGHGGYF